MYCIVLAVYEFTETYYLAMFSAQILIDVRSTIVDMPFFLILDITKTALKVREIR